MADQKSTEAFVDRVRAAAKSPTPFLFRIMTSSHTGCQADEDQMKPRSYSLPKTQYGSIAFLKNGSKVVGDQVKNHLQNKKKGTQLTSWTHSLPLCMAMAKSMAEDESLTLYILNTMELREQDSKKLIINAGTLLDICQPMQTSQNSKTCYRDYGDEFLIHGTIHAHVYNAVKWSNLPKQDLNMFIHTFPLPKKITPWLKVRAEDPSVKTNHSKRLNGAVNIADVFEPDFRLPVMSSLMTIFKGDVSPDMLERTTKALTHPIHGDRRSANPNAFLDISTDFDHQGHFEAVYAAALTRHIAQRKHTGNVQDEAFRQVLNDLSSRERDHWRAKAILQVSHRSEIANDVQARYARFLRGEKENSLSDVDSIDEEGEGIVRSQRWWLKLPLALKAGQRAFSESWKTA